jgi:hypothetical protein
MCRVSDGDDAIYVGERYASEGNNPRLTLTAGPASSSAQSEKRSRRMNNPGRKEKNRAVRRLADSFICLLNLINTTFRKKIYNRWCCVNRLGWQPFIGSLPSAPNVPLGRLPVLEHSLR